MARRVMLFSKLYNLFSAPEGYSVMPNAIFLPFDLFSLLYLPFYSPNHAIRFHPVSLDFLHKSRYSFFVEHWLRCCKNR